jgi:peptidyl-prolyl cis-trans isomerase C
MVRVIACAMLAGLPTAILPAADVAVTVNGVALARWEVDREVQKRLPWTSFHRSVDDQRMAELERDALNQLVTLELKWQWALAEGIQVPQDAVAAELSATRSRFPSPEAYLEALDQRGMTEADLRRAVARDVVAAEVDERVLATVREPTPLEVETYFIMHREDYVTPEQRHLVHVVVPVLPGAPAEAWEAAEIEASAVASAARSGEVTLLDEANRRRDTIAPRLRDQTGDLGALHRGSLIAVLDEAVFAPDVESGSVVGPIRTIYGFSVLEVLDVIPPRPLTLDEVRTAIAAQLRSSWRNAAIEEFEQDLLDAATVQGEAWPAAP